MNLTFDTEREEDGRWIAEVPQLPGVMAYGATEGEAKAKAEALALRVLADRIDHGEAEADYDSRRGVSKFPAAKALSGHARGRRRS